MRPRVLIVVPVLAVLLVGCKRHPAVHGHRVQYGDHVQLNRLPEGRYDALFSCNEVAAENWYIAGASFYDDSGHVYSEDTIRRYHTPPSIAVTLNGQNIVGYDERVHLQNPDPLIWRVKGNDHYPSVEHTMYPDSLIQFFSPNATDTLSLAEDIDVKYHAPKTIDTVIFHYTYFGESVYKLKNGRSDTSGGESFYDKVPNGDHYVLKHFQMREDMISFKPRELMIQIMSERADSVHVGDYVYGFVTECHNTRFYTLKP